MLLSLILYWKTAKPKFKGFWFKLLCSGSRLKIGKNFQCDTFPNLLLTQKGKLKIGDNVYLRQNVEIRAHNDAEVIIENDIRIDRGVRILAANNSSIKINSGTRIGLYSVLNGGDSILIKNNCLISGFVYLQTSMHRHQNNTAIKDQGYDHKPIILEENCWLGAHVVILPGVTLGNKCIVGSNAVVTKSVAANNTVVGIPAKTINKI